MSSLRSDAPAFVPPAAHGYAGVVTVAPLWLLEDSDDDEDDHEEYIGGKTAKDMDNDSGMASTDDCGITTDEDSDSENEEQPESPRSQHSVSSVKVSSDAGEKKGAGSAMEELQAELQRAREHARASLEESRQLAAETRLVTELREARAQATQLAQNLQATGVSALECAVSHATQKAASHPWTRPACPQPEADKLALPSCLSLLESEKSTEDESESAAQVDQLPSKGSVLHAQGGCKSCSFFPMGRCDKGVDCPFCHLPHDRRKERKMRRKERISSASELKAAAVDTPPGLEVASVGQLLAAPSDAEIALAVQAAVRSELLKRFGSPPGLELVAPPGL